MEWKNSKPYISGENQNRFELSKPSLLSTVMVILLLLVLLLLGWCCCILNFDGFLIVLEFLWKFWWIFEFWWILGFWWQLEWVWTTFQFHSLCSSYVTPFALLCNCGTAVGRYIKWNFTYVLLRCFFRHSEPSSIDFFGWRFRRIDVVFRWKYNWKLWEKCFSYHYEEMAWRFFSCQKER